MDLNSLENKLAILLAKYDIQNNKKKNNSDSPTTSTDMSELSLLQRENQELKRQLEAQKEIIDLFRTKYLDLSIEYNSKIDRIRENHQNELKNLHSQFKTRLRNNKND